MDQQDKRIFPTPVSPEETIHIESLGGDVLVRGVPLLGQQRILKAARSEEEDKNGCSGTAYMLSICVFQLDGTKIYSMHEWDIWAGANLDDANKLSRAATKLIGLYKDEAEKK